MQMFEHFKSNFSSLNSGARQVENNHMYFA
jgi:hypothetical protein